MNVAFIPVRGGSKSIPLKNIKEMCGRPLVYWTIKAACECSYIDCVYVATESEEIKTTINEFKSEEEKFEKIEVVGRSLESASDTASTEFAMLEFACQFEFDNIVLIQATSPLLTSKDLDLGFVTYQTEGTDSVISVVRQKRFNWKYDNLGFVHSTNYDVFDRPRRQEFEGYLVENGAFYITSKERLLDTGNRVSGNIKAVEMNEDSFFEIDEPSDWTIVESLLGKRISEHTTEKPEIKMFLTDCDGCLTDGGMYYSENGDELKRFSALDGMGFKLLRERGILTGIITGEERELNYRRAQKLKLDIFEAGVQDKLCVVQKICDKYHIGLQNVAYVGDDINDLEVIKNVGFGCSVKNGMTVVKEVATFVAEKEGGRGAVREIIDKVIEMLEMKK